MSSQRSDKSAGRQAGQDRKHGKMRSELIVRDRYKWIERKSELAAPLGSFAAEECFDDKFLRKVEERRKKKSMGKKEQDLGAKKCMRKKEQELEKREKDLKRKENLDRERDNAIKKLLGRREAELAKKVIEQGIQEKSKEQDLKRRERDLEKRGKYLEGREQELNMRVEELEGREKQLAVAEIMWREEEEKIVSVTTDKGLNVATKTSDAEVVASAEMLSANVELKVTEILKRLEVLHRRSGVQAESLEVLSKVHEVEDMEKKEAHKLQNRNMEIKMVFERTELYKRIETALKVRADKAFCSTMEEMTRCREKLQDLYFEEEKLDNRQDQGLRDMEHQQERAKTQMKKNQQASSLALLQDRPCHSALLARAASLRRSLALLTSRPARLLRAPGCPVCLEELTPPIKIAQCGSGHLVCLPCTARLGRLECPTCRQRLAGRAIAVEQLLEDWFCHYQAEETKDAGGHKNVQDPIRHTLQQVEGPGLLVDAQERQEEQGQAQALGQPESSLGGSRTFNPCKMSALLTVYWLVAAFPLYNVLVQN